MFFLQFPVSIGLNQPWRHNIAFYDKDVDAEYVGEKKLGQDDKQINWLGINTIYDNNIAIKFRIRQQ